MGDVDLMSMPWIFPDDTVFDAFLDFSDTSTSSTATNLMLEERSSYIVSRNHCFSAGVDSSGHGPLLKFKRIIRSLAVLTINQVRARLFRSSLQHFEEKDGVTRYRPRFSHLFVYVIICSSTTLLMCGSSQFSILGDL